MENDGRVFLILSEGGNRIKHEAIFLFRRNFRIKIWMVWFYILFICYLFLGA